MKLNFVYKCIALSLLTFTFCFLAFDAFLHQKTFTAIISFGLAIGCQIACWFQFIARLKESEKIITSIHQKDFSLHPQTTKNDDFKNNIVKLYYQAKKEDKEIYSYKNLYDSIFNKLEFGLVILKKNEKTNNWQIFYSNPSFSRILKVPKYNDWEFYAEKTPEFYQLIENTNFEDSQEFIDISIQESTAQSYSIRTSRLSSFDDDFFVISMESVQKIIDTKEKKAWNNLMKVISHELLNTLTPINSLLHNLEYVTNQESLSDDDQEEIKDSLKIINSKSQQLLHFIDSYRQIAELPKPKKSKINLKSTIEKVLRIFENEFKINQISISIQTLDYFVQADETMIERVLINLITNSQLALQTIKNKKINILLAETNSRIVLSITDNGVGIDPQIENKIFLPFFTTRTHGSGIGLTLSKSIMEAHYGYLIFRRLKQGSTFEMWFTQ